MGHSGLKKCYGRSNSHNEKKIRVWLFFLVKASIFRVYSCTDRPFFKVIVALVVFWGPMAVRNGVVVVHDSLLLVFAWSLKDD